MRVGAMYGTAPAATSASIGISTSLRCICMPCSVPASCMHCHATSIRVTKCRFLHLLATDRKAMPIRPQHRNLYPIDWKEISHSIRFERAGGRCESCRRHHGDCIRQHTDGRWFDTRAGAWRDDSGMIATDPSLLEVLHVVLKQVVLATCHVNHDRSNCSGNNLAAWCGRCHLRHDLPEHKRQRRLTYLRRRAVGDLFTGEYPTI